MRIHAVHVEVTGLSPDGKEAVFRGNVLRHNQYGVKGDGTGPGHSTIARYFPSIVLWLPKVAGMLD